MADQYYPPYTSAEETDYDFNLQYPGQTTQPQPVSSLYVSQQQPNPYDPRTIYSDTSVFYQQPQLFLQPQPQPQPQPSTTISSSSSSQQHHHHPQFYQTPELQQQQWISSADPMDYRYQQPNVAPFPQPALPSVFQQPQLQPQQQQHQQHLIAPDSGPSSMVPPPRYLSPDSAKYASRVSRSRSFASDVSSVRSDTSRSVSPSASEMAKWGFRNELGTWSCAYPGCSSRSTFTRGCDLRKHYKRHTKSLFCRHEGCPQATEGGFSSVKDRARHEAKHNPAIVCEFEGCDRLFSRQDNMKDHVRRVHKRQSAPVRRTR